MANLGRQNNRRAIASWCLYDWANSAFNTLVVTFIYSTFFGETFTDDPGHGMALWSRGIAISALFVAVLAPIAGVLADRGNRHRYLIGCTLTCVAMTGALTFVRPGQANATFIALAIFVVANVAFEVGLVFYNAFLPSIAPPGRIGRVSGYGWGLGYAGGLVCLALALLFVTGDPPPFSMSAVDGFNIRATNLLAATWFLLFSLPMFFFVKDTHVRNVRFEVGKAFTDLARTLTHLRRYREVVRFLIARLVYNDGLVTIFAFGGLYAAGTFGFTIREVIVFGIALNVVAGVGAWVFGFVDDQVGGKVTVAISLVFLSVSTVVAAVAPNRFWLWIAGCGIGFFLGPNQSASRSLMGRFVPKARESAFFGFFAFSGKVTAFIGPILLGLLSDSFGQRVGVASVTLFFIVGGVLLMRVNERQGIAAANQGSAA